MNRLIASSILVFVLATPSFAQTAPLPTKPDELLAMADLNNDGSISRDEFLTVRSASFSRIDMDTSGGLTVSEFQTILSDRVSRFAGRAFSRVDADGDGVITQAEWDANPPEIFDRADKNGDGVLSPAEREAKRYKR